MTPTTPSPISSGLPENFDCKALTIADELFPIDKPPSHAVVNEFARRIAFLVNAPISDQAAGEPIVWKLVPERPTDAMMVAAWKLWEAPGDRQFNVWRAMLAAAPTAPTTGSAPGAAIGCHATGQGVANSANAVAALSGGYASPAASVPDSALAEIYTAACEWTDDWAERQETTPTKQMNDAIFIRRVMALLAASMGGDKP